MSQGSRGPDRSDKNTQYGSTSGPGGSVRRARERVEAGLPPEQSRRIRDPAVGGPAVPITKTPRLRLSPGDHPTYPPQDYGHRSILPRGPKPRLVLPHSGTPTSYTTSPSTSQWPLLEEDESTQHPNNSPTGDRVYGKGPPPRRPPRPSYVPSILDTVKNPKIMPLHHRQTQQSEKVQAPTQQSPHDWENSYIISSSDETGPPGTASTSMSGSSSSKPSTSSSVGSIPEFPTPGIPIPPPLQTRRSANLGPPPSSRRGASSYYSQSSYVTPIPEELPEPAQNPHGSYASSHVIPSNWGESQPGYYVGEEEEDLNEGDNGQELKGGDHDDSTGLVRKASLGKRHKPSLTTIRSSEGLNNDGATRLGDNNTNQTVEDSSVESNLASRSVTTTGVTGEAFTRSISSSENDQRSTNNGGFEDGKGLVDASSSSLIEDPEKTSYALENVVPFGTVQDGSRSSVSPAVDERVKQIMGGLERGGALQSGTPSPATMTSPGEKSIKRPPRLNIDAVKEAEARGSLTSLPDLIRRATRLASNLDRGRTASRLGMRDMLIAGEATEKDRSPHSRAHSGSLTDILASFPPPGLSTPTPTGDRSSPRWPSPFAKSNLAVGQVGSSTEDASDFTKSKRSRKCCGMPLWAFALLLVVLVLLIAAAVVIPVALIVLPRQRMAAANAAAAADLSNCQRSNPCANGGTSIITADACSCICVNGFTGATCNQQSDSGCVTVNLNSNAQSQAPLNNVTLGNSIPRLISAAQSNFSIPLKSSAILSMFSAANLSCTSENALVTFNSRSQRRDLSFQKIGLMPAFSLPSIATPSLVPRRDASLSVTFSFNEEPYPSSAGGFYTSDGIILASSTAKTPSLTIPTPLITATATATASASATSQTVSPRDIDFARVVVLYIFQETRLDNAVVAQGKLQGLFDGGGFNRSDIAVGNGVTVNFGTGTVNLGNGTVVGGSGG